MKELKIKKIKLLLFLPFLLLANDEELYKRADLLEQEGKYKEALEIYKEINKKNKNIKVEDSFTKIKEEQFNNINYIKDPETRETIKQSYIGAFDLHPYKKTYIMPVTYDFKNSEDREQKETQFQFSLEKPLIHNLFNQNEIISFAYTQKSFWQTFKESAPFRENNYEPEFLVNIPIENDYLKSYKISLNHQSNGQGGLLSRSWNRVYLEGMLQFDELFVKPKIWYIIPDGNQNDNPNIENYMGYGELNFIYSYKKHQFDLLLRNNLKSDNKGAIDLTWTFPLPFIENQKNVYGMINYFNGYGNSLIDYDRQVNKIGFGIALTR